jgi:hypothetical protein
MQSLPRHAGLEGHSAKIIGLLRLTTSQLPWIPPTLHKITVVELAQDLCLWTTTTTTTPELNVSRSWLPYTPSPTDEKVKDVRERLSRARDRSSLCGL